jgi:hypothetical protein
VVGMPVFRDSKPLAVGATGCDIPVETGTLVEIDIKKGRVQVDVQEGVPLVAPSSSASTARTMRATSGTRVTSSSKSSHLRLGAGGGTRPLPIVGHEWRQMQNGWVLWRRLPSKSDKGVRTSQRKYVGFYSNKTVEALYGKK